MSTEINEVVDIVEKKLDESVKKYEEQVKLAGSASNEMRAEVKKLSEMHAEEIKKISARMKEIEQKSQEVVNVGRAQQKSWGESLIASSHFEDFKNRNRQSVQVSVKNTILGEGGSPQDPIDTIVAPDRREGIVPGAFRALNLLDFIPTGRTNSNQIQYTRELAWTNDAAETAEAAQKPESDLTFELVDDPVRTIAHFIKVSRQVLDDAPALASYIDARLRHGVRVRLQKQILVGNGTSPNIAGLTVSGRHTAFTPTTGENGIDSLNRAKAAVLAADYSPDVIVMNPTDFSALERIKTGTGRNDYAAGGGAALSYINNGMVPLLWGLPVVLNNEVASGKFYMFDTAALQLFTRQDVNVAMTDSNEDDFEKNLITIRAEGRFALAVFTPVAVRYGSLTL